VIIPTRNRWPMLSTHACRACSLRRRSRSRSWSSDDASDDGTAEHVEALADARVGSSGTRTSVGSASRNVWRRGSPRRVARVSRRRRPLVATQGPRAARQRTGGRRSWVYASALSSTPSCGRSMPPVSAPEALEALLRGGNHVPGRRLERHRPRRRLSMRSVGSTRSPLLRGLGSVAHDCAESTLAGRVCRECSWDAFEHRLRTCSSETEADVEVGLRARPLRGRARSQVRSGGGRGVDCPRAHACGLQLPTRRVYYARAAVAYRSPGNAVAAAGALFGRRGLSAASRLLVAYRGATHLEEAAFPIRPRRRSGWRPFRSRRLRIAGTAARYPRPMRFLTALVVGAFVVASSAAGANPAKPASCVGAAPAHERGLDRRDEREPSSVSRQLPRLPPHITETLHQELLDRRRPERRCGRRGRITVDELGPDDSYEDNTAIKVRFGNPRARSISRGSSSTVSTS
jgi:hypothetical protein